MLITPLQLQDEPLQLDHSFAPGDIDFGELVTQVGALPVKGEADLITEHRGPRDLVHDIRLRAGYIGCFETLCARCVEPVQQSLNQQFDLIFRPSSADAVTGEHSITPDDTEIGYYEQSGLLLEDVVREQVLLSLPDRALCRPDCKGLCPRCGQNLNQKACSCVAAPADIRWNALADLADRIKK
jgi:uncharacterized protein